MSYLVIKHAHVTFVVISLSLFLLRVALTVRGIAWRNWLWLRVLPHVNDTLLLVAGIGLAVLAGFQPFDHPWLMLKLILLPLYVLTGARALKASQKAKQLQWAVMALTLFAAMLTLAVFKPFF